MSEFEPGADFLLIELDAGLTFAAIARQASNVELRARNFAQAHASLMKIKRLLSRAALSAREEWKLYVRMKELELAIAKIPLPDLAVLMDETPSIA